MTLIMRGISVVVGLLFLCMLGIALNTPHILERGHTDALPHLSTYRDGTCDGKWVYYSLSRGTILVACGLRETSNPKQCLFVPFRVTEDMGSRVLERGEAYNTTVFVTPCWKAKSYAAENGYMEWQQVPLDQRAAIVSVFGNP